MNWTFSRSAAPLSPWIRCWFSSGIGVGYRNKLLCKKFVSESIMCRTIVNHTSKTQTILWKSSLRLFPLLEYRGLIRRDIKVPITISVVMCVNYQDSVSGMKWEKNVFKWKTNTRCQSDVKKHDDRSAILSLWPLFFDFISMFFFYIDGYQWTWVSVSLTHMPHCSSLPLHAWLWLSLT